VPPPHPSHQLGEEGAHAPAARRRRASPARARPASGAPPRGARSSQTPCLAPPPGHGARGAPSSEQPCPLAPGVEKLKTALVDAVWRAGEEAR
jgi:hypothetical protein